MAATTCVVTANTKSTWTPFTISTSTYAIAGIFILENAGKAEIATADCVLWVW
jgi:hypothetical protein